MFRPNNNFRPSFDRNNNNRVAPVREGEELDVRIEAVGEKGDGIAKKQGFVLFIPNTKTGDEVRIKVTKVLKSAGFAEVIGAPTGKIQSGSQPSPRQRSKSEEDEAKELEAASKEMDSENFGEEDEIDKGEAEQVADTVEEDAEDSEEDK